MDEIDFDEVMNKLTSPVTEGEGENQTTRDLTRGEVITLSTDVNNHVNKLNATIETQTKEIEKLKMDKEHLNMSVGKLLMQQGIKKEETTKHNTPKLEDEEKVFDWA